MNKALEFLLRAIELAPTAVKTFEELKEYLARATASVKGGKEPTEIDWAWLRSQEAANRTALRKRAAEAEKGA